MSETKWTIGPWEYIPSTEHHGPYVAAPFGGDIADCYTMSDPGALSVRNGGTSRPIHFQHDRADANARLIAAAPDLAEALEPFVALAAIFRDEPDDMPVYRPARGPEITLGDLRKARAALARAKGAS